jgi:helix-turn-helix, Psq domain
MTHQIRFHLLQLSLTPPMGYKRASKASDLDLRVQKAVSAYHNQEFTSIRAAATHFQISDRTLARRIAGGKSRAQAREIT